MSTTSSLTQNQLDAIFPPERTDAFFDALFGGAEEGAYNIRLKCAEVNAAEARLYFELHQRPGKCLVCSLTYGLPQVFSRHPIINAKGVAEDVAKCLGWDATRVTWQLGRTEESSREEHRIPMIVRPA